MHAGGADVTSDGADGANEPRGWGMLLSGSLAVLYEGSEINCWCCDWAPVKSMETFQESLRLQENH